MGVLSEFRCYISLLTKSRQCNSCIELPLPDPKASCQPVPCFLLAHPPQLHLALPCLFLHLGSPSQAPESRVASQDLAPLHFSASFLSLFRGRRKRKKCGEAAKCRAFLSKRDRNAPALPRGSFQRGKQPLTVGQLWGFTPFNWRFALSPGGPT